MKKITLPDKTTVDKLIKVLKKLSDEGHGETPVIVQDMITGLTPLNIIYIDKNIVELRSEGGVR